MSSLTVYDLIMMNSWTWDKN